MLDNPILKLVIGAAVASLVGYLINQLPAIRQFPGRGWLVGGLLFCITLLGLAMQALTDDKIDEAIKIWVRYGSIAVLTLLLVQIIGLVWLCRSRSTEPQDLRSRVLRDLLFEVKKRLQDSLTDSVLIPLDYEEKPETVGDAPKRNLVPAEEPAEPLTWLGRLNPVRLLKRRGKATIELEPQETMLAVFERVNRKLLILGEPGAGKTITLLTLAQELIQKAIADPTQPIPVIFELSNWKQDSQSIADWLVEQLSDRVSRTNRKKVKQWLEAGQVLPLLDGLDELRDRQKQGTEALNRYVQGNLGADLVVCCRNEEYLQAGVILEQLNSAVCLQPLSDSQIEDYFGQMERPQIWQKVQQEAGLRQLLEPDADGKTGMLRIPLFLKMMLEVEPQENRPIRNRQDLLNAYIVYRLDPKTIKAERGQTRRHEWAFAPAKEPNQEKTRRYLVWLAKHLVSTRETEFLIEKMQPTLLETPAQQWKYQLTLGLFVGLIAGLIFGLLGLSAGLVFGLILGLLGLFVGLIAGMIDKQYEIELIEAFKFSIRHFTRQESLEGLRQWLIVGRFYGLLGLIIGLIAELIVRSTFGSIGLVYGLTSLVSGLVFVLTGSLISGLKDELRTRDQPNQGIWQSAKNVWIIAFFSYLPGVAIALSGIFEGRVAVGESSLLPGSSSEVLLLKILLPALEIALIFGYCLGGGLACTRHFALRFILWKNRRIPWNYARFLRYAAERRLIQQIGGRYRFLHRELLEHFAQMPHP